MSANIGREKKSLCPIDYYYETSLKLWNHSFQIIKPSVLTAAYFHHASFFWPTTILPLIQNLFSMFSVQCSVISVQCSVISAQFSVFSVQCSAVQCSICIVQCSVCNVQCALRSIQFTVCGEHSWVSSYLKWFKCCSHALNQLNHVEDRVQTEQQKEILPGGHRLLSEYF